MEIGEQAYQHIKKITKNNKLFEYFARDKNYTSPEQPTTFFMAGSPGAGKTEFSKWFVKNNYEEADIPILRIDADEIRELCPEYNGKNSHLFQRAVSYGVSQLYYYALKKNYNLLLDSTFSNFEHAKTNVQLALSKNRQTYIMYIYQDPVRAWEFTLKREEIENRKITLMVFIDGFFQAKENVNKIKARYKNKVNLDLIIKNYTNDNKKFIIDIDSVDRYIKDEYTKESLSEKLKNVNI